ncbi:MAG: hypothetical protein LC689_12995 [Myxococcales bacterium]|nr:hypothetical protein [Myxococcales bacterium]
MSKLPAPQFPDPSAAPVDCAELIARWEAVLTRAPRLRPWLEQTIRQRRVLLHESARGSIERVLWIELERWVRQFEALPQFAVSAIAVTVESPGEQRSPAVSERVNAVHHAASPERAIGESEALLQDPAFALAFHCVETRVRPALHEPPPATAWFGILHASARPQPLLTSEVAVGLVLRVLSAEWSRLPPSTRKAALRLFQATQADLRAAERLRAICDALPWEIEPDVFVAGAARARASLQEACALFARVAAVARPTQRGGLAVLQVDRAAPATPAELAELSETARKFSTMTGLRRLLALL